MFSESTTAKAKKYLRDFPDLVVQQDGKIWTVKQYRIYALSAGGYSCTCPHGQNNAQAVCYHAACVDLRREELGEAPEEPEELEEREAAAQTLLGVVSPKDEEEVDWGEVQIRFDETAEDAETASEDTEEGEDRDA